MNLPNSELIVTYLTVAAAVLGALLAALWLSLIIWAFRDMRLRSRDPFAQLLAALLVAALPIFGILIYFILRPPQTLAAVYERMLEEEALLQQIEERPSCPGCSRTVNDSWILCPHCHTRLKKACPDCNSLMELQWNLCPFCGNQHVDPYKADSVGIPAASIEVSNGSNGHEKTAVSPPAPADEAEDDAETAVVEN